MTLALNQQDNKITYISEIAKQAANIGFVLPKTVYSATEILDMIKATKTAVKDVDITSLQKGLSNKSDKQIENIVGLINEHNKKVLDYINKLNDKTCVPYGIQYITYNISTENGTNDIKVLISQHKSRLLKLSDGLVPLEYKPKRTTLVLKISAISGCTQNNVIVIRTTKIEKVLTYIATFILCMGILGGTVAIMNRIDIIQNAKIAAEQVQDIEVLTNDEIIDKWVTDFENCEINFDRTINPEYFVSNVKFFDKVIEEIVEHTDNIQIEKVKEGYKIEADISRVSQYSSIINAPLTRPDISKIKENLKTGRNDESEIHEQLENVKFGLFSDFCFIDTPDTETIHIDSILTVEDGRVKGSFDFLNKVLDASGIRNNIMVFDAEIGEYMYNVVTDSGKEGN